MQRRGRDAADGKRKEMEIREYREYNEREILPLYAAAGWTAYTAHPETLRKAFESSAIILAAYEGDKLTGLLRAVGDGQTVMFIQDLLVDPEHRRKGAGTALLKAIQERFRHVRQMHLVTDDTPETAAFYQAAGFTELSEAGCLGFTRI